MPPRSVIVEPPGGDPRPSGPSGDQGRDYQRLFQASPTPTLVVDHATLAVLAANPAATRAFGYSEEEFLDGAFPDFVSAADRAALLRLPEPAPVPGLLEARSAWDLVRRDGTSQRAEVATSAVTFRGRPCAILYQVPAPEPDARDVGRSGASLPEFSFSALHDLKEPLHLVRGYLSLLRERAGGHLDSEAADYLESAMGGAQRMQAIVLSLLEYFRVDAKGIAREPIELRDALDDALAGLRLQAEEAGADIAGDHLPRVLADRVQVGRVLQNLLSNALKFRRPGTSPRIRVSSRRLEGPPAQWQVTVRDDGIGIDPKDQERVLQPFQRVHSTDVYPGTGLGLSISRRIVERHGGRLWIESSLGKGTAIHFTLPAEVL